MLQYIKDYGRYVEITGFRNVRFSDAEAFLKANRKRTRSSINLQFFDADVVATREHLYFSVLNALQAFRSRTNLSKSLAVETMLYASAQRQIKRAIELSGIKPQTTSMAVTVVGEDPSEIRALLRRISRCVGGEPDETVLELTEAKLERIKEAFQIQTEEIKTVKTNKGEEEAVVSLVIERVALLATQL